MPDAASDGIRQGAVTPLPPAGRRARFAADFGRRSLAWSEDRDRLRRQGGDRRAFILFKDAIHAGGVEYNPRRRLESDEFGIDIPFGSCTSQRSRPPPGEAGSMVPLAQAVFWFHVAVIAFNVFGLVAIPLGAWQGWRFVRVFWWRALHLAVLALVALQALFDRACFLTLWQADLLHAAGRPASSAPLIERWATRLLFWPVPVWVFAMLYVAVWLYALALWRWVPPRRG